MSGLGRGSRKRVCPAPAPHFTALSLLVCYLVQPDWLLTLPFVPRFASVLLTFVPIYLANVASPNGSARPTIRSPRSASTCWAPCSAVPGVLALLTGYRSLLLVVGALYLVAFLLAPRRGRGLVSV